MFGLRKFDSLVNYKNYASKHENEIIKVWKKIKESKREKSLMTDRHLDTASNVDEIATEP